MKVFTPFLASLLLLPAMVTGGDRSIEGVTVIRGSTVTVYRADKPAAKVAVVGEERSQLYPHTVQITGMVERPGAYAWHKEMTLGDLLAKARPIRITGVTLMVTMAHDRQRVIFLLPGPGDPQFKEVLEDGQRVEIEGSLPTKYY